MNHPNDNVRLTHAEDLGAYVPRPDECSALPSDVSKAQAIGVICKALQVMGLARSAITAWRSIADQTEASAWGSTTDTPVNFRKAKDLARAHNVSDRHWRRIESQLEIAGVLSRATSDNGFRGKICKGTIVFGLNLEPAIRNFATLQEKANRPELLELKRKQTLGEIRALRQRLKKYAAFEPLTAEQTAAWEGVEADYRPTRPGYASLADLKIYLTALSEVEEAIRQRFNNNDEQASFKESCSEKLTEMSAPADSDVRHQCNLQYKKQTLNAVIHSDLEKTAQTIQNGGTTKQKLSNKPRSRATSELSQSKHLSGAHKLRIAEIKLVSSIPGLLDDIRRQKIGTPCAKLDPNHIWQRFKRYNLKRDKQVLPVAALRAFIKGWIPNKLETYSTTKIRLNSSQHPTRCNHARKLDFYVKLIKSDSFIPQTMVSKALAEELCASGMVNKQDLTARGILV